jgi:hypothetical protein
MSIRFHEFDLLKTQPRVEKSYHSFVQPLYAYYPGSGIDVSAIENLRRTLGIKVFIHVDYIIEPYQLEELKAGLQHKQYSIVETVDLGPDSLQAGLTWNDYWHPKSKGAFGLSADAYAKAFKLETDEKEIFHLLFMRTEALGTYTLLNRFLSTPHVVVLQDHGLGCFWTPFGGNSIFYGDALRTGHLPHYLYVDTHTEVWPNYVSCGEPENCVGMFANTQQKALFKRLQLVDRPPYTPAPALFRPGPLKSNFLAASKKPNARKPTR